MMINDAGHIGLAILRIQIYFGGSLRLLLVHSDVPVQCSRAVGPRFGVFG